MALGLEQCGLRQLLLVCSAVPSEGFRSFVAYDYEGGFDGQTTQFAITNVSAEAQNRPHHGVDRLFGRDP